MRASSTESVCLGLAVPVTLPLRSTVARVAELLHLVQLVADVEDAAPLGGQLAQRLEQLDDGLRRQHRGRLVEDQQLGLLQQAAHDLDALALADRKIVDQPRRDRSACRSARDSVDALAATALQGRKALLTKARCSRPRRRIRTARNAGRPSRCRAPRETAGLCASIRLPSQMISPESACAAP